MNTPQIAIIDIDSTISDARPRVQKYITNMPREDIDWESFYGEVATDDPIIAMVAMVRALENAGAIVEVVTGRNESCREETEYWISQVAKLHPRNIYMRARYDRRSASEVKKDIVSNLININDVSIVFDDAPEVLRMYKKLIPHAVIVDCSAYRV